MTQVPPDGGDGAPDQSRDPHAPTPPPYPGGYPPPGVPPVPAPPPPAPPGSMPPPTAGTWPGQVPPPGGAFPYGGARPPGDAGYVPPPYGAPGYGAPAYGSGPSGELAGYGARLGGWLIDLVILVVVGAIVLLPLHAVRHDHVVVRGTYTYRYHLNGVGLLLYAVIVIIYGGLLCGSQRGQTVGMMAAHTRAVSASDSSASIGYPRAFGRAAFEYLMSAVFLIPWVVDMLFPLWDPKNQTLHDKVANTVVIKV